jgi:branched-chain amino acid aminotransferase
MGLPVREERYSLEQWAADSASGRLRECFACGTAAVVTPIGNVRGAGIDFTIGGQSIGPLTERLRTALVGIQRGELPDPHGWIEELD